MRNDGKLIGFNSAMVEKARELRKNMSRQEKHLWYDFLSKYPVKWVKQRPFDEFVVDFYCSKAKLVIEIDDSQHYSERGLAYDSERTEVMKKYSLEVIRFSNTDIDRLFPAVCEYIDRKVKERLGEIT